MSEFLADAGRSGVYRVVRAQWMLDTARRRGLTVAHVCLDGRPDKDALLRALAAALRFPQWFGGNWDALEDCLADLSWLPPSGCLILVEGVQALAQDDRRLLSEIFSTVAQFWKARGRPFYAVFVTDTETLPELTAAAES